MNVDVSFAINMPRVARDIIGASDWERGIDETVLKAWLDATGRSSTSFARECRMKQSWMLRLIQGRALPNLIDAFRIERASKGAVPVSSWLGTAIGKAYWAHAGSDWSNADALRNAWKTRKMREKREQAKNKG